MTDPLALAEAPLVHEPLAADEEVVEDVRFVLFLGPRAATVQRIRLGADDVEPALVEVRGRASGRTTTWEVATVSTPPDLSERLAAICELGEPLGLDFNLEPMPWTDVKNLQQGTRVVTASGRTNAGVLIDPIHFDRAGNVPADIAAVARERLRYAQLCDAPAERPRDTETLLYQARAERLMPGDGGLDLVGILRTLPAELPLALEVPMLTLAKTVPAVERAKRIRTKTEALLARVSQL